MRDFERGTVEANGLRLHYLAAGKGRLALCLHGFPDSPWTYRHLLPQLAAAGYRAVAPFSRGYAPTELPPDRHHIHASTLVADVLALHEALDGCDNAVLIGHDWGAVAAWGAAARRPDRWAQCVIVNIPPLEIVGENSTRYDQIKRSFYVWFFQMRHVVEATVSANDFEFIDRLWGDWSPGYDASEDLRLVKDCIRDPAHLQAALGYYWGQFDPTRFGSAEWAQEQAAAWGHGLRQPTLYLHGTTDGCQAISPEQLARVPDCCGRGSEAELIDGVGHFMLVERPGPINDKILSFLRRTAPAQTAHPAARV
jgi:pimeloyl-ACP methyl ester carboxylesterase